MIDEDEPTRRYRWVMDPIPVLVVEPNAAQPAEDPANATTGVDELPPTKMRRVPAGARKLMEATEWYRELQGVASKLKPPVGTAHRFVPLSKEERHVMRALATAIMNVRVATVEWERAGRPPLR